MAGTQEFMVVAAPDVAVLCTNVIVWSMVFFVCYKYFGWKAMIYVPFTCFIIGYCLRPPHESPSTYIDNSINALSIFVKRNPLETTLYAVDDILKYTTEKYSEIEDFVKDVAGDKLGTLAKEAKDVINSAVDNAKYTFYTVSGVVTGVAITIVMAARSLLNPCR